MQEAEQKIVQYLNEAHRGDEPGPGYDELSVSEIRAVLDEGDEDRIRRARSYERAHKNRTGVMDAAERELAKS